MIKNSHCEDEKITCHPELVSGSNDTEPLKHGCQSDVQGEGSKSLHKTLSRICKFAYCSLTNSTLSQRERVKSKNAFTLAEVLITLGIIGIVAAMTLPALIQNHKKHVVETRLKKFYSTMNQAVARSKAENGDVQNWFEDIYGTSTDVRQKRDEYFIQYIGKYLNIIKTEERSMGKIYYLSDGSSFSLINGNANGRDWVYSPGDLNICMQKNANSYYNYIGTCGFAFLFYNDSGFRTYDFDWNGTENSLKNHTSFGCYSGSWHAYCTRLIQYNGWKIPDDYPYRIMIY
ncbi:type II secretion system protein [bacterium]|nr:type II secretion system protein [bacterium]